MPKDAPRIIAIVNQKGGVGKTTTAINLGAGLAQNNQKVLIIDLDPQGNASTGLGFPPESRKRTSYSVMTGDEKITDCVQQTGIENLYAIAASNDLSGTDVELVDDERRTNRLKDQIEGARQFLDQYNYILIDCPPSLNLLTVNAMVAAHSVLVPLQCEFFALEGLSQLLGTVQRLQQSLNRNLRVEGIVLTMYDRRNRLSAQVAEDVRENLGDYVYQTMIPRNVRLSEAPSHAVPALVYDPDCAGSVAYRALAKELARRTGHITAA